MAEDQDPPELHIRLLGGFQVALGGRRIPNNDWHLRKARNLLKLLALAPTHRIHHEVILELLWPRLGELAARNNLSSALHTIRNALAAADPQTPPAAYLEREQAQLVLCPAARLWTDVQHFEAAAARARENADPATYEAALALYTGDLLPDDRNEEWTIGPREALRMLHDKLLLTVAHLYEAQGAYPRAVGTLERIVAADPAHEQAQRQLMRLHALQDQRHLALRQYQLLREALQQELDVEPAAVTRRLYEDIVAERFPLSAPAGAPANTSEEQATAALPAAASAAAGDPALHPGQGAPAAPQSDRDSFISREQDVAELRRLLSTTRLLTLVGGGGRGKSRLARRLAENLRDTYPDGVYLVDLAPLADPRLVPQAVAAAAGVRDTAERPLLDILAAYLQVREALLVLDNCEHLLPACRQLITALLAEGAILQILVTSRQALSLVEEIPWHVPPLSLPPERPAPALAALRHVDAVRLFLARGRASQPGLALTPDNAQGIAHLCRQLDGHPLAIELAAAHLATTSIEALSQQLDTTVERRNGSNAAFSAPRQVPRSTLEWCQRSLSAPEQVLFRRLAVFAGGWQCQATAPVGADHQLEARTVPELLGRLVETALVRTEGPARYRLPEMVRQYAAEQLQAAGETHWARQRHAAHYLTVAEQAMAAPLGAHQQRSLEQLELDLDNLRVALQHALESGDRETALRLAAALWWFWSVRGYLSEGRSWLQAALAMSGETPETLLATRARVLHGAGVLAYLQGDSAAVSALHQEALALNRQLGDRRGMALALGSLALLAHNQGDYERSASLYEETLPLLEAAGDLHAYAATLDSLGALRADQGDAERASALHQRALALFETLGDARGVARTLGKLGADALQIGDYLRAPGLLADALARLRQLDDRPGINQALQSLATLAQQQDDFPRAGELLREALTLSRELGDQQGIAGAQLGLARVALRQRDLGRALALGLESEQLHRANEYTPGIAAALLHRGDVARALADPRGALLRYQESLALPRQGRAWTTIGRCLDGMAAAALALGDHAAAARLLGMATAARAAGGTPPVPLDHVEHRRLLAQVRTAIGEPPFSALYEAGRAIEPAQALAEARALRMQPPPVANRDIMEEVSTAIRRLSEREGEVARLITRGLTNRQIAGTLQIERRTVDTYVQRIFKKLRISGRKEIPPEVV